MPQAIANVKPPAMPTPAEARMILEDPENRLEHLGASLYVLGQSIADWFEVHQERKVDAVGIARCYMAAAVMVGMHFGGLGS